MYWYVARNTGSFSLLPLSYFPSFFMHWVSDWIEGVRMEIAAGQTGSTLLETTPHDDHLDRPKSGRECWTFRDRNWHNFSRILLFYVAFMNSPVQSLQMNTKLETDIRYRVCQKSFFPLGSEREVAKCSAAQSWNTHCDDTFSEPRENSFGGLCIHETSGRGHRISCKTFPYHSFCRIRLIMSRKRASDESCGASDSLNLTRNWNRKGIRERNRFLIHNSSFRKEAEIIPINDSWLWGINTTLQLTQLFHTKHEPLSPPDFIRITDLDLGRFLPKRRRLCLFVSKIGNERLFRRPL